MPVSRLYLASKISVSKTIDSGHLYANNLVPSHIAGAVRVWQKRLWLSLAIASLTALSGCQATKGVFNNFEDGTLTYQEAEQIEPMQLPADQQTAPFIPLYPTPKLGVSTIDVVNESGKRYELPKPYQRVAVVAED